MGFFSCGQHPFVTSAKPVSALAPLVISVKKKKEETKMWQSHKDIISATSTNYDYRLGL